MSRERYIERRATDVNPDAGAISRPGLDTRHHLGDAAPQIGRPVPLGRRFSRLNLIGLGECDLRHVLGRQGSDV
jgi:hypothetical protein